MPSKRRNYVANLLPVPKAYDALHDAISEYQKCLGRFNRAKGAVKRAEWLIVQDAYSKMSAAHWELQQAFAAAGSK